MFSLREGAVKRTIILGVLAVTSVCAVIIACGGNPSGVAVPIEVSVPSSSTVWQHYQTGATIQWSGGNTDNVSIRIMKDGELLELLASSAPNSGTYTLSKSVPASWGTGTDYTIMIEDGLGEAGTSSSFEIAAADSATLFFDDFEWETVGQMPSQWTVYYSGQALQVVSNPAVGTKSFMVQGAPSWVGSAYHSIEINEDFILEADVYIPSGGMDGEDYTIYYDGLNTNRFGIKFYKVGTNQLELGWGGTVLPGTFSCNQWNHVRLEANVSTNLYNVYCNGSYLGTLTATDGDNRSLYVAACNWHQSSAQRIVYFDNVHLSAP